MTTDTTPVAAPAVETPDSYDAMSAVFDTLVAPEGTPPADATPEVADDAAPAAAPAAAEADPPTESPPADGAPAVAAAAPEGEVPAAPAAGDEDTTDWKAAYEALKAAPPAAPAAAAPAPEPAAPTKDEGPPAITYSDAEKAILAEYETPDWETVRKGEALIRRSEYNQLVHHVFAEFQRVYAPLIERGAQAAEQVAETATLSAIRSVHADYSDTMYDAVTAWANGLNGMQKKTALAIINEGEPQDVIDLISEYKAVTAKPKVTAAAPVAATAKVTELSPTAKKAASVLSVVDSKRSNPTQGSADKNDFEGAWAEAMSAQS